VLVARGVGSDAFRRGEVLARRRDRLASGWFSESIELGLWGDGWLTHKMPGSPRRSRVTRSEARALIARAGGRRRFHYGPWPRKAPEGAADL
jgi:hypothetical protein